MMTRDQERSGRFHEAVAAASRGQFVVDLGAGEDLNWARAAASSGASRVVAIEESPESYARALAKMAQDPPARSVEVILGNSLDVDLGESADILVSETIGNIGSSEGAAVTLSRARGTLLKQDGLVIPDSVRTFGALGNLRGLLGTDTPAFGSAAKHYVDAIFRWWGGPFDVRLAIANPIQSELYSDPIELERLEFNSTISETDSRIGPVAVTRDGVVDCLMCWIELSVAPDLPPLDTLRVPTSWSPCVMVFPESISVTQGQSGVMRFESRLSDDGLHPDYFVDLELNRSPSNVNVVLESLHHAGTFGGTAFYRELFAGWSSRV
ncbi:MAG: hypothetical protein CMH82_05195 [Nocardioides sp.]|nr:hypothetical protein [Nocardioides sp.]